MYCGNLSNNFVTKGEAEMKITWIAGKINLNQVMAISVDVHKDDLNFVKPLVIL
jgi:hypothetical protein